MDLDEIAELQYLTTEQRKKTPANSGCRPKVKFALKIPAFTKRQTVIGHYIKLHPSN